MTKIITYGTFDLFHHGHLELLRRAKKLGDHLTIGLSTDEFNKDEKNKVSHQKYTKRKENLEAIKYVDEIIPESNWQQKEKDVQNYNIDVFTIGDDWEGEFDFLKPFCSVVYLPRTSNISSSDIRQTIERVTQGNQVI